MSILRRSILAVPFAAAWSQSGDATAQEARKAMDSFIAAVQKNDVSGAGRYLSDDLIYTHSTGVVETKNEYLAKLRTGDQKYSGIEFLNPKIRTWGNAAVLNTQARMTGASKGVPFDNTLFLMQVWVKQGNDWRMVAHQTTMKPK
jgi:ketosteroid isomerase-like protein